MERGVYHAQQKALSHTVEPNKNVDPAAISQGNRGQPAELAPATRQPLEEKQTIWLGQSLKEKRQPKLPFRYSALNVQACGSVGQFLI